MTFGNGLRRLAACLIGTLGLLALALALSAQAQPVPVKVCLPDIDVAAVFLS
jgi:hypothetical protein